MQALSRGQFLRRTAVATGGLALLEPATALGRAAGEPRPIPGGFDASFTMVPSDPFIHVLPPGLGFEMSTITDFTGAVGGSEIRGTASGNGTTYSFDTDMRFMQGTYVDLDGRVQHGSFGFI
jgi:hypothetical protein